MTLAGRRPGEADLLALEWSNRAIEAEPTNEQAHFNLAVARQSLGLGLDSRALPSPDTGLQLRHFEDELLPKLMERAVGNLAPMDLPRVLEQAAALTRASGDRFLEDVAREVAADPARALPALGAFLKSRRAYRSGDYSAAASGALAAEKAAPGSAIAVGASWTRALTLLQGFSSDEFTAQARLVLAEARARSFLTIEASVETWLGVQAENVLRLSVAEAHHRRALALRNQAGNYSDGAVAEVNLSRVLWEIGEGPKSWEHLVAALRTVATVPGAARQFVIDQATVRCRRRQLFRAARTLLSIAYADGSKQAPLLEMNHLWARHELEREAGQNADALRLAAETRKVLATIEAEEVRRQQAALLDASEGSLLAQSGAESAQQRLTRARDAFRATGQSALLSKVLFDLAQLQIRLADPVAAAASLEEAARMLEVGRGSAGVNPERFFARAEDVFGTWIDLLLDDNQIERALEVSERSRALTLLDDLRRRHPGVIPTAGEAIRRVLASGRPERFIILDRTPRRIVLWSIANGRVDSASRMAERRITVSESELTSLLSSVGPTDNRGDIIWVSPPGLQEPPALSVPVWHVPSLRVWESLGAISRPRAQLRRVVVVADPRARARAGSQVLAPLPGARLEAQRARLLFPGARVFLGEQATRIALLEEGAEADLLVVAVHALRGPSGATRLVLAGPEGGLDILDPIDIRQARFRHSPVVLLAGCATASGEPLPLEGIAGLESAFLAAGARLVGATTETLVDNSSVLDWVGRPLRPNQAPAGLRWTGIPAKSSFETVQ